METTSNGGCRREEKSRNHWSFFTKLVFSHCKSNRKQFYVLIALKSEKNRTEPNDVDELKCSKSLNQTTSYAL